MTAGTRQRSAGGDDVLLAWAVPGVALLAAVGTGAVWLGGTLASGITGHRFTAPPLNRPAVGLLLRDGPSALWPGVDVHVIWTVTAVLLFVVLVSLAFVAAVVVGRFSARSRNPDPARFLATRSEIGALTGPPSWAKARQLRPALPPGSRGRRQLDPRGVGLPLGTLARTGTPLRSSWEDVALAVFAPRAGKTTSLAVPAILDAPGPVVATSNKSDLWAATATLRATRAGAGPAPRIWTFDPQLITRSPQSWCWNPLSGLTSVDQAHRLAGHFVQEICTEGRTDFWSSAAHDLLTSLVLAAAVSDRTLVDVFDWLNDPVSTPETVLVDHGYPSVASSLRGRRNGAPETRDGIYETARTAAQCLRDDTIMAWVTPAYGLPEFDPDAFAVSADTLYLLSKDGAGAAAPLVAALTDRVIRAAVLAAEDRGGRLDPPLVVVLDEAANICRISDLPDLYSHLGSRGVVPLTILQSFRQGVRVWGEAGMDALWSASTIKLIGPGIDDPKFAADVSHLIGDHDVATTSVSNGASGRSTSTSQRRQAILPPERIRDMPRGRALLLATGIRAAVVQLTPWYDGPRRDEIAAAINTAAKTMSRPVSEPEVAA
jgi:type IV secretory pathway TraG/TraD family ATPase VirD4